MNLILCFAGRRKSGKTTLSKAISDERNWKRFSFGDYIRSKAKKMTEYQIITKKKDKRKFLQDLGSKLIEEQGPEKFVKEFFREQNWDNTENIIIDGVRHKEILFELLTYSLKAYMIFIKINDDTVRNRIPENDSTDEDFQQYLESEQHSTETQVIETLELYADKVIDGTCKPNILVNEINNWLEEKEQEEKIHREKVIQAINQARSIGLTSFEEILRFIGGADPFLVERLMNSPHSGKEKTIPSNEEIREKQDKARQLSASLLNDFPSANPLASQWWFSLESVICLSKQLWKLAEGKPVAFLGAPTVGYHYAISYSVDNNLIILDSDYHVTEVLHEKLKKILNSTEYAKKYNVYNSLLDSQKNQYAAVLIDPPWYLPEIKIFLQRATELIKTPGYILCTLPSIYTRPNVVKERTRLIKLLLKGNYEIISLDAKNVKYRVPDFELQVLKRNIKQNEEMIMGRMWRTGDLLCLRVLKSSKLDIEPQSYTEIEIFARNPKKRRFFLDPSNICDSDERICMEIVEFNSSISTREYHKNRITVWGTNKKALNFFNADIARVILQSWKEKKSLNETTELLRENFKTISEEINLPDVVRQFNNILGLWKDENINHIRTADQRENGNIKRLSDFAIKERKDSREHGFVLDRNRTDFQRDRDRILWSHSFRRLANKTQLFPTGSDESLRRRLTHSIEVMQLALTIANVFGLNTDLTAAGALAHDIGHAPFGHAGEVAINKTLNEISELLGGFNHYEHGVDVVRYLDDMYWSSGIGPHPGLNLIWETMECIFKHTFFRSRKDCSQSQEDRELSQEELSELSKHEFLRDNTSCHLEGQAVRIADKISYLVSDIEDGIRLDVIKLNDLRECKFFERSPIDIVPRSRETLFERIISQRRGIIHILMSDLIDVTNENLAKFHSLDEIRNCKDSYIVCFSREIALELKEIWEKLQQGKLHKNRLVVAENSNATKIISNLLLLYIFKPEFIDESFLRSHKKLNKTDYMQYYKNKIGEQIEIPKRISERFNYSNQIANNTTGNKKIEIPIDRVISAVDFTASLTDIQAKEEYQKYWRLFD